MDTGNELFLKQRLFEENILRLQVFEHVFCGFLLCFKSVVRLSSILLELWLIRLLYLAMVLTHWWDRPSVFLLDIWSFLASPLILHLAQDCWDYQTLFLISKSHINHLTIQLHVLIDRHELQVLLWRSLYRFCHRPDLGNWVYGLNLRSVRVGFPRFSSQYAMEWALGCFCFLSQFGVVLVMSKAIGIDERLFFLFNGLSILSVLWVRSRLYCPLLVNRRVNRLSFLFHSFCWLFGVFSVFVKFQISYKSMINWLGSSLLLSFPVVIYCVESFVYC